MKNLWFLFFAIICGNIQAQVFDPARFAGGDGTKESPYLIATQSQLAYFAETVNDVSGCSNGIYFQLSADIYLSTNLIIGKSETSSFEGFFDGAEHRIFGFLQRFNYDNDYAGLFGYTTGAVIRRLTLDGGKIQSIEGISGGCLIGYARQTTVENCFVEGVDIIFPGHVGGIIGSAVDTDISDCGYSGSVIGSGKSTGGFIGSAVNITVTRCFSEGTVSGGSFTGGFIGRMEADKRDEKNTINACYASVETAGIGYVGGFIGYIFYLENSSTTINYCHATGSVSGKSDRVGGFIGYCDDKSTVISDCYAAGNVISPAATDVGGFIGYDRGLTITRCFAVGAVEGNESVGGFSGFSDSSISLCYAVGAVEGDRYAGGFTGYASGSVINGCFAAGAVLCPNSAGGFLGSAYLVTGNACFFDKQGTGLVSGIGNGAFTGVQALTSSELCQNNLFGFLSNDWEYTTNHYPQLKVFAQSGNNATKTWSALSAVPLRLANDNELSSDVQTIIRLSEKTTEGHTLTWATAAAENVAIMNQSVYAEASEAWHTLTLRADDAERYVKFRSTKGLLVPEIVGVRINNTDYNMTEAQFTYLIDCDSKEEYVFAEIILTPYAKSTPGSPVTLYANQTQNVVVTTDNGQTKTYSFYAEKYLSSDIFIQRWSDVLAVNNNADTNGGYDFTDYQWYKNDEKLPDTNGYIRLSGEGQYSATLSGILISAHESVTRGVCPVVISEMTPIVAVYPNPVQRGRIISVTTGETASIARLFDLTGNILYKKNLNNPIAEIAMPNTPGTYILRLTINEAEQSFKIVVE